MSVPERVDFTPILNEEFLIFILDDDLEFCRAIHSYLMLDRYPSRYYVDSWQAVRDLSHFAPHALIFNMTVKGKSTLPVIEMINDKREVPVPVILLANQPTVTYIDDYEYGVADILRKPLDGRELLRTLKGVLHTPDGEDRAARRRRLRTIRGWGDLTPREKDVVEMIVQGKSSKEVGRNLGISHRTVEVHRANALSKLGAANTVDLVRLSL
jgi:Response regulator